MTSMSPSSSTTGWRRLAMVVGGTLAAYVLLFEILDGAIAGFLVWIEFLAPAAGLSGLWMVFSVPVLFFLAVFATGWISAGFRGTGVATNGE